MHFLSGYDLAIADQAVWEYSKLKIPISTAQAYYGQSILADHFEIIYALLSPFYLLYNNVVTLIVLQNLFITLSIVPIFLIAKKYKVNAITAYCLSVAYLLFYGIQFAIWTDVHSLVFAASFLPWFVYFLEIKKIRYAFLFFVLSILSKEDIALLTFVISGIFVITKKYTPAWIFALISVVYMAFIFGYFFPHLTRDGYRYAPHSGILSNLDLINMINTKERQDVYLYSLGSFGFLPLLAPLYLLPSLADLFHYFVLGNAVVTSAQGIFQHYRVTLPLLLTWPMIIAINKYKLLNKWYIGVYILLCSLFFQYYLHLPLSYLTKSWFWQNPAYVSTINEAIQKIPADAGVVSQPNIIPHLSHRYEAYTLWPQVRNDIENKPCGEPICYWFKWGGNPQYLIIDTSNNWDIRHFLTFRPDFEKGISNLEKYSYIKQVYAKGTTRVFKILKKP